MKGHDAHIRLSCKVPRVLLLYSIVLIFVPQNIGLFLLRSKRSTFGCHRKVSQIKSSAAAWGLKIPEKVSLNIASEASYVYILRLNIGTRQVSFNKTKIGRKCRNSIETFLIIFKHCALSLTIQLKNCICESIFYMIYL